MIHYILLLVSIVFTAKEAYGCLPIEDSCIKNGEACCESTSVDKPDVRTAEVLNDMDDTSLFSDESHIFKRIDNFRQESRLAIEDDIKEATGEVGPARAGSGLRSFTWMVNTDMARVGYGGSFDVLMHSDFHKRDYWGDYNTYEAQVVAEI